MWLSPWYFDTVVGCVGTASYVIADRIDFHKIRYPCLATNQTLRVITVLRAQRMCSYYTEDENARYPHPRIP